MRVTSKPGKFLLGSCKICMDKQYGEERELKCPFCQSRCNDEGRKGSFITPSAKSLNPHRIGPCRSHYHRNIFPVSERTVGMRVMWKASVILVCIDHWIQPSVNSENESTLVCVTKTWTREGKTVALRDLTPPGFSVLYQSRTRGRGGVTLLIREDFTFLRPLPTLKIAGIDCVGPSVVS